MIKKCVICGEEFDAKGSSKVCSVPCRKKSAALSSKKYIVQHIDKIRDVQRRYRFENKIKRKAWMKKYYLENKDKFRLYVISWRKLHPEQTRINARRWSLKNANYNTQRRKQRIKLKQEQEASLMFQTLTLT